LSLIFSSLCFAYDVLDRNFGSSRAEALQVGIVIKTGFGNNRKMPRLQAQSALLLKGGIASLSDKASFLDFNGMVRTVPREIEERLRNVDLPRFYLKK
jgi:hypothetical protein